MQVIMNNLARILFHKYVTVENKLYLEINNVWKIGSRLSVHL